MIKKIIKELAIFLLLAVAIILIFTVLFYDSNPINKVIPEKFLLNMINIYLYIYKF